MMAHVIGLHANSTTKDLADRFLREVWKLHGLPSAIIADMDAKFAGELSESLCKMLGVTRRMATVCHLKLTDKQREPTHSWKVTYKHLSITIRTTGINYCRYPKMPIITRQPMHTK